MRESIPAPTYAIGLLSDVQPGAAIVEYLQRVDATLAPFDGHFIIHGGSPTVLEGSWSADLIVIEFPSYEHASGWYNSPAYQEIIGLRAGSARSTIALVPGVPADHLATDVLTAV